MKKTLPMTATLLALTVGLVSAAGLNLGWQDCAGLGAGAANRTFACDTNSGGGHTLVGSFVAPAGLTTVGGWAAVIDLQTAGTTLSPWWEIGYSYCRPAGASHSADFTGGPFSCTDYFGQNVPGSGVFRLPPNTSGANRLRIEEGWNYGTSSLDPRDIPVDTEVYAWKCTLNNTKTVGLGSCTGCSSGACIVFNELVITKQHESRTQWKLTNPALRAYVTWNGGGGVPCPDATPARNTTWGMIKTLYR